MKKCPFCAELIQDEAIKCRYCAETLTVQAPAPAVAAAAPKKASAMEKLLLWFAVCGAFLVIVIAQMMEPSSSSAPAPPSKPYIRSGEVYKTVEGWYVAPTEEDFELVTNAVIAKDQEAVLKMLMTGRAMRLDGTQEAQCIDRVRVGVIKLRLKGSSQVLWANVEALGGE